VRWQLEVAKRDAGGGRGGDAGFGSDNLGKRERPNGGAQQKKAGRLGRLLGRDLAVGQHVDERGREEAGPDAHAESLQKGKQRRGHAHVVQQRRLEDYHGRDGCGHVVDDPLGLEGGGDVFAHPDHLEDGRDDGRARRDQQRADEKGEFPLDALEEPDRRRRPHQGQGRADGHETQ
jgi:hypothetical protein